MAVCYNGLTFSFDDISSSMYNLYMGWRGSSEEWDTGITREIVKSEPNMVNHIANQYGTTYSDVLLLEFDIYHQDGSPFTYRESRNINNWLTKETYKRFKVNDYNTDNIYYKAICTSISDLADGDFFGKHIVLQCDSPFGYTGEKTRVIDATISGDEIWTIDNSSDDGIYYPLVHIECAGDYEGNVQIINTSLDRTMTLEMVQIPVRETDNKKVLDIDGQHLQITDYAGNLVPLYLLGWTIVPNANEAVPLDYMYWFRLKPGINRVELKGNAKFKITVSFPRKVGQLEEQHLPM